MSDDDLNPPQRDAVAHTRGPLLLLAGAGSGKTRVITRRLANLVDRGVRPWRILAVTFTNKAAGEMRERAGKLLGDDARKLWVGTFHSVCTRLLRVYAERAGLRPDFLIFDTDDCRSLMLRVMKDAGISDKTASPRQLLQGIDRAKNQGIGADEFAGDDYLSDLVARVYPEYQKRLRAQNGVDFGDLLVEVLRLCERDSVAAEDLATRFDHVLVDEFQDTNRVQYRIVRHLSSRTHNLCVVGDDDQSIYRWRGADLRNILDFEADHAGCTTIRLEQNYRSTQTILDAANAVIARNVDRKPKRLFTENGKGDPILYFTAQDERNEARFVVRGMQTLIAEEERAPGDFAVFYRTHAQSRLLEEELRAANMAYTVVGGTRFYDRAEVKDLLAYLRVLVNPSDEVSLERIVNVPARGIGDTTVEKIAQHARWMEIPLWQAMRAAADDATGEVLGTGPRRKLKEFVALVDELRADAGLKPAPKQGVLDFSATATTSRPRVATQLDLDALAQRVLERTGYVEKLAADGTRESEDRLANLQQLLLSLRDYQRSPGPDEEEPSLVGYLERVSLVSNADGASKGVSLMTVHAAKGLEFPVVFVTGLEEGTFPRVERGAPREEMEEERRLAYVAITRARERLILTNSARRQRYGDLGAVAMTPLLDGGDPSSLRESRFIADIPTELVVRPVPQIRRVTEPGYDRSSSGRGNYGGGYGGRSSSSGGGYGGGYSGRSGGHRAERRGPSVEDRGGGVTVEREDEPVSRIPAAPSRGATIRYDEAETRVEYDEASETYRPGRRVRHSQFGEGKIVTASGSGDKAKLTVYFPSVGATKTVIARFLEPL